MYAGLVAGVLVFVGLEVRWPRLARLQLNGRKQNESNRLQRWGNGSIEQR